DRSLQYWVTPPTVVSPLMSHRGTGGNMHDMDLRVDGRLFVAYHDDCSVGVFDGAPQLMAAPIPSIRLALGIASETAATAAATATAPS
ncbi:hypothetical protein OH407_24315, partial [Salmonella enterica]|uniref:hypothetical protein n=1 Tax=Salmonella enterica TaxID=28901 RepID=UPI0022B6A75D